MIKSDRWIKRVALDNGDDRALRGEADPPRGGISYGLSSYGHDIRIADAFKIFTNVYNTGVDPEAFDPRSFVDVRGDVCIIPPNSFAPGRSVEYRAPQGLMLFRTRWA